MGTPREMNPDNSNDWGGIHVSHPPPLFLWEQLPDNIPVDNIPNSHVQDGPRGVLWKGWGIGMGAIPLEPAKPAPEPGHFPHSQHLGCTRNALPALLIPNPRCQNLLQLLQEVKKSQNLSQKCSLASLKRNNQPQSAQNPHSEPLGL